MDKLPATTTTITTSSQKTDPLGVTTHYQYDPLTNKVTHTQREEITISSTYDTTGALTSRTDPNGNITEYVYDDHTTTVFHPDHTMETFHYNPDNTLASHIDEAGNTTHYTYDSLGRVLTAGEESYRYDTFQTLSYKDPKGHFTSYGYDKVGNFTSESRHVRTVYHSYNHFNQRISSKLGNLTTFYKKDPLDRILEKNHNDLLKTTYTYDERGNLTSKNNHQYKYDEQNRLVEHKDPLGNIYTTEHSDYQSITTDPNGHTTTRTYDIHGRLIQKDQTEYTYDLNGNILTKGPHRFTYDGRDRITSYTSDEGKTTSYIYTPTTKTKTLPNGITLTYTYDRDNNLIKLTSSDNQIHHTFRYDKLGYLLEATDHINQITVQREVDLFGNILSEEVTNLPTLYKTYDDQDRPLTIQIEGEEPIYFTYDPVYLREIKYKNLTHTYDAYDMQGHLLSQNNGQIQYERD